MSTEYNLFVSHLTILRFITNTFINDPSNTFVEDESNNKEYWIKLINHFFGYGFEDPFAENLVMNSNGQAFADAFAEIINYKPDFNGLWHTPINSVDLRSKCTFMPRLHNNEIDLFYSRYNVTSKLDSSQTANPFLLVVGNNMPGFKAHKVIHHSFHPTYYAARCEIIKHGVSEASVHNFKNNTDFKYDTEEISIKSHPNSNFKYEWYVISDTRVITSPNPYGDLKIK